MQRKNFLKTIVGIAASVPALTSVAVAIPKPDVLPEVRNRPFTIKQIIQNVCPMVLPDKVTEEQAIELMNRTRRAGFVMYNSTKVNQPSITACWMVDSDDLLAKGDILHKSLKEASLFITWEIIGVEKTWGDGVSKCQVILARAYGHHTITDLPREGDKLYLIA